jgi:hypothetical protein
MDKSIGKPKRHNQILIKTVSGEEWYFRKVLQTDLDLMITQMEIDLEKDFSTSDLIKQNVDAGQWILVLDSDSAQGLVIHTQPQGLIFLLDT